MSLGDFHPEVNEHILKILHQEMVKEYVAGGGKEDEHPFEIDIETAHNWVKEMRKLIESRDEIACTFKWMYDEGMASQFYKAVVMHSKSMQLHKFPWKLYA